jgi:hypothetical protein
MANEEPIWKKLNELKSETSNLAQKMPTESGKNEELSRLSQTLKILSSQDIPYTNPLYVAIESRAIAEVSGQVMSMMTGTTPAPPSVPVGEIKKVVTESLNLDKEAGKMVEEEHVSDAFAEYLTVANYSQIISSELIEMGKEVQHVQMDQEKMGVIADSIVDKLRDGFLRIPGKIKKFANDVWDRVQELKTTIVGGVKNGILAGLKKVADTLYKFLSHLIGAFFSLASFLQREAAQKDFNISEISIEIEPFDLQTIPGIPIAVPKFQTPKISAKFIPK